MGKKNTTLKILKETFLIGLVGFPIGLLWCGTCLQSFEWTMKAGLFSSAIWIFMWEGNGLLSDYLTRKIPWLSNPSKRLLYGVVAMVIYTVGTMFLLNLVFEWIWNVNTGMMESVYGFISTAGIAVGITVVISLFVNARAFFLSWKQSAVNEEKLKRESLKSQFEALKAQINPHFLFNSLNVLSGLVYQDAELSARFIKQLSLVYRYLLDNQTKEVISIKEEMEFIQSYLFLQQIRFGENLNVDISIDPTANFQVPPLALQILIENAIKHNEVSEEYPLKITIKEDGDYIVVGNPLRKKNRPVQNSSRIGLKNLRERYEFLTEHEVEVVENSDLFEVRIPKIMMYESSYIGG